jgi:hypothetical protein
MKKSKSELLKIISFLLFIVLADKFTGGILKNLYQASTDFTISKIRYTLYQTKEDILIFGSSRAQHHYNPDTISKLTGYETYNCGLGGQFLTFSLIQISETLKRYKPQLIILDLYPDMLLQKHFDQKLKILEPYYKNDTLIREILNQSSGFERLKHISSIYPYNSQLYPLLLSLVYSPDIGIKGYIPVYGIIDTSLSVNQEAGEIHEIADKQMINLCQISNICQENKVALWIVVSPVYKKTKEDFQIIRDIGVYAKEHDVHFTDFSENPFFSDHFLFKDNLHLNSDGANIYSRIVGDSILQLTRKIL